MNAKNLRFGAWAGIASLVIMVLMTPMIFVVTAESDIFLKIASVSVQTIATILTVVLLYVLLGYFRTMSIPRVDRYLSVLIVVEIIGMLLIAGSMISPVWESLMLVPVIALIVTVGVLFILFGIAVSGRDGDVFELARPFGIVSIIMGALMVSIIGVIPALPLMLAWTVLAVMILFKAASKYDLQPNDNS